jgi:hypothetical protein
MESSYQTQAVVFDMMTPCSLSSAASLLVFDMMTPCSLSSAASLLVFDMMTPCSLSSAMRIWNLVALHSFDIICNTYVQTPPTFIM